MDEQKALNNLMYFALSSLFFPDKVNERTIKESEKTLKKMIKEKEALEKIKNRISTSSKIELKIEGFNEKDYERYENLILTKNELDCIIICLNNLCFFNDKERDIERKTLLTKLVLYREEMERRK